ncbi:MAG: SusC/RagA family TonB-linked outer membrane protein [Rikenellaceae bacterium]
MGLLSQDGVVAKNNYLRYNGRVNLTTQIAPKVKMTVRLQGVSARVKEPNTAGTIDGEGMLMIIQQGAIRFPGTRPNKLSSGNWGPGFKGFGSAQSWIESPSFYNQNQFKLNSNIKFDYTPIKGLTLSAMGGYNFNNNVDKYYRATIPVEVNGRVNTLGPSTLRNNSANVGYKTFQGTANYSKEFASGHSLDILVGYSWEDQSSRGINASRDNFPGNDLPYLDAGSPENQKNSGAGYDWALQSVFGRAQYNYKERYLAEVTMRYDGSSRFPQDEKYGFFPSAAIGWRLSQENFIKNNDGLRFINNLKLKASYGILGNNNIGNYPYQSVYALGNNYSFGGTVAQGAQMTTYNDPRLRWETTRTADAGVEASFWRGLLSINATYFHRDTYDVLYKASASVSSIYGLTPSETNTGEVKNTGWEFEIGHRNTVGDFTYGVNGNFSIIKNNVESLGIGNVDQPNGLVGNGSNLFIGLPMQMYYGYKSDGVFLDQNDIDDYFSRIDQTSMGSNKTTTKPGDIRYQDISGPDGKPDGKVDATYDRVYLGSQIPKYTFGLSLNASFKGFDASALFQGVGGVKGMLSGYAGWAMWSEGNVQRWQADGAFNPEKPERNPAYPRISNLGNAIGVNTQTSDFWVRNASYLRLKNLQVGYTIPNRITSRAKISQVRIYASMENVVTWSKYPQGWDPETNTGGSFYPFLSTYVFGLNLKF